MDELTLSRISYFAFDNDNTSKRIKEVSVMVAKAVRDCDSNLLYESFKRLLRVDASTIEDLIASNAMKFAIEGIMSKNVDVREVLELEKIDKTISQELVKSVDISFNEKEIDSLIIDCLKLGVISEAKTLSSMKDFIENIDSMYESVAKEESKKEEAHRRSVRKKAAAREEVKAAGSREETSQERLKDVSEVSHSIVSTDKIVEDNVEVVRGRHVSNMRMVMKGNLINISSVEESVTPVKDKRKYSKITARLNFGGGDIIKEYAVEDRIKEHKTVAKKKLSVPSSTSIIKIEEVEDHVKRKGTKSDFESTLKLSLSISKRSIISESEVKDEEKRRTAGDRRVEKTSVNFGDNTFIGEMSIIE